MLLDAHGGHFGHRNDQNPGGYLFPLFHKAVFANRMGGDLPQAVDAAGDDRFFVYIALRILNRYLPVGDGLVGNRLFHGDKGQGIQQGLSRRFHIRGCPDGHRTVAQPKLLLLCQAAGDGAVIDIPTGHVNDQLGQRLIVLCGHQKLVPQHEEIPLLRQTAEKLVAQIRLGLLHHLKVDLVVAVRSSSGAQQDKTGQQNHGQRHKQAAQLGSADTADGMFLHIEPPSDYKELQHVTIKIPFFVLPVNLYF